MDLKGIGCEDVDGFYLAKGNHGNEPSDPIKGGEFIE